MHIRMMIALQTDIFIARESIKTEGISKIACLVTMKAVMRTLWAVLRERGAGDVIVAECMSNS